MPLTKSIALEVAEAEELDRDCSNKYHPQKWRPAVVGTEVIPVVTQPIDPQLLVLKWFLWSRNLLTLYFSRGQTQPLSTIPGVTQPLLLLRNWPMQPFEKRTNQHSVKIITRLLVLYFIKCDVTVDVCDTIYIFSHNLLMIVPRYPISGYVPGYGYHHYYLPWYGHDLSADILYHSSLFLVLFFGWCFECICNNYVLVLFFFWIKIKQTYYSFKKRHLALIYY